MHIMRHKIVSLPKLKHIWKNNASVLGFQNLLWITIDKCHDLKYVFPNVSIATSLLNLSYLCVYECNNMEEIIHNNSDSDSVSTQQQQQPKEGKNIFPSLKIIVLIELPSLKCFCQSSFPCHVELPQCEEITIEDCREMNTFWYDGTLHTPCLVDI